MKVAKKIILMFTRLAKENKAERETGILEFETINSLFLLRNFIISEGLDVDKLSIVNQNHVSNSDAVMALMDIMDDPAKAAAAARRENDRLQAKIRSLEQQIIVLSESSPPAKGATKKRDKKRGTTPHSDFRNPILHVIYNHGGRLASFTKIIKSNSSLLGLTFSSIDLELTQSGNPKWLVNLGNAANVMIQQGLLVRDRGVWSLTEKGMAEAEARK